LQAGTLFGKDGQALCHARPLEAIIKAREPACGSSKTMYRD